MIHILLINFFDCFQSFLECRRAVCDLAVRKHLARLNGVAVTDFPRSDTNLLSQNIDQRFQCELTLTYTKAAERTGRRIIGVVAIATNVGILVAVWSYRMGTCTLQNRSAEGCVCTGIKVDLTIQTGKDTILITAQCKGSFHCMAFRMEI